MLLDRLAEQGAGRGEVVFYQGELYRRRDDEGDREKALQAYREALRLEGAPAATHRSLGLVAWAGGETEAARTAFERYLAEAGDDAPDRAIIRSYIARLGADT